MECIFVDGASKDESLAIASDFYGDDHLISEPDDGIYQAMNKGLSLASGEWVLWLNSGDEFIAGCWNDLRQLLLTTAATVVCGASDIIDQNTGECVRTNYARNTDLPWGMVNHSSAFFRRGIVLRLGGYNESYKIAADRDLLVRLHFAGATFEFLDSSLSRFWLGGLSDKQLFLRSVENLRLDLQAGLIGVSEYRYAYVRGLIFFKLVRPAVQLFREKLAVLGIKLPSLGAYAGPLGELRRDAFARKRSS